MIELHKCSYATSIGARLFVTSAKTGIGIDDMFFDIVKRKFTTQEPISFELLKFWHNLCFYLLICHSHPGLMDKRRESTEGLLTAPPKRGLVIIDDEPEKEPPPRCCS